MEEIKFWYPDKENGYLSNLYPVSLIFEKITFNSSEQAYQYNKILDKESDLAKIILSETTQRKIAEVGHSIEEKNMIKDWFKVREKIMYKIVLAKFQQNEILANYLKQTGNKKIIENSPIDFFWGIGDGTGSNRLGEILMEVRNQLI